MIIAIYASVSKSMDSSPSLYSNEDKGACIYSVLRAYWGVIVAVIVNGG